MDVILVNVAVVGDLIRVACGSEGEKRHQFSKILNLHQRIDT